MAQSYPEVGSSKPPRECVQRFASGASRDRDEDKYDYEGFLSPLVLERFGAYMHRNRQLPDGTLRDSDNWQKGMPRMKYLKSLWRHFRQAWSLMRGYETRDERGALIDLEDALCGVLFNAMGLLHEVLIKRDVGVGATTNSLLSCYMRS